MSGKPIFSDDPTISPIVRFRNALDGILAVSSLSDAQHIARTSLDCILVDDLPDDLFTEVDEPSEAYADDDNCSDYDDHNVE